MKNLRPEPEAVRVDMVDKARTLSAVPCFGTFRKDLLQGLPEIVDRVGAGALIFGGIGGVHTGEDVVGVGPVLSVGVPGAGAGLARLAQGPVDEGQDVTVLAVVGRAEGGGAGAVGDFFRRRRVLRRLIPRPSSCQSRSPRDIIQTSKAGAPAGHRIRKEKT